MQIYFTKALTQEMGAKLEAIHSLEYECVYFENKFYGEDLQHLYIHVICVSDKFEQFFKPRKAVYRKDAKVYIHKGIQVSSPARSLLCDLKLGYEKYASEPDIQEILANDILVSLQEIKSCRKIKDFDFDSFEKDFKSIFVDLNWL